MAIKTNIYYTNRWASATITASGTAIGDFSLANCKTIQPSEIARISLDAGGEGWLQADLGAEYRLANVCVRDHDLTNTGQFKVQIADNAAMTSPVYDSGFVDAWASSVFTANSDFGDANGKPNADGKKLLPQAVFYNDFTEIVTGGRHVKISVKDAAKANGTFECSLVNASKKYSTDVYHPFRIWSDEVTDIRTSRSGQDWITSLFKRFRGESVYEGQDEAAANFWIFLMNEVGLTGTFFAALRDDSAFWKAYSTTLWEFADVPTIEHQANTGNFIGVYRAKVSLTEVIG